MFRPLLTIALLLSLAPTVRAELQSVARPDPSTDVVVSIAVSAGVLEPGAFPVSGRSCDAVLSELRDARDFAGQIRDTYEPPTDPGRCFNLEGKRSQIAVVCCAPAP